MSRWEQRGARGATPAVAIALCLASILAWPASSAGQEKRKSGKRKPAAALRLARPAKQSRTIQLEPLPDRTGSYTGHLTLLVVNRTRRRGRVGVMYARTAGRRSNPLSKRPGKAIRLSSPRKRIAAPPKRTVAIPLTFTLPGARSPSWLDGTILLNLNGAGRKAARKASLSVPVRAAFAPLTDIALHPAEVTIQAIKLWPTGEADAKVEMTGTGATALLRHDPPFSASVVFGDGEGNRVSVTLQDLRRNGSGGVDATIAVVKPMPGKYTGELAVGAGKNPPGFSLIVNSHFSIWVPIVVVLVSSILGGLLPMLRGVGRRRNLMRLSLKSAIQRYKQVREDPEFGEGVLWDMDEEMGPKPWLALKWSAISKADGYAGLYAELRWVRNDKDLDALSPEVTEAVETIMSWVSLYEPGRQLRAASRLDPPPRNGEEWHDTELAADTNALLAELRKRTVKTDEAGALSLRCTEQAAWHEAVCDAWSAITAAQSNESLSEPQRKALSELDLGPLVNPGREQGEPERDSREMGRLTYKLSAMLKKAERIAGPLVAPQLEGIGDHAPVKKVYLAIQQEAALRENETRDAVYPVDTGAEHALTQILLMDWMVTLVIATGAVLVYVTPFYDATWGSSSDLLAAAGVGFGSQVVVQWAGQPLFQSLRQREERRREEKEGVGKDATAAAPAPERVS